MPNGYDTMSFWRAYRFRIKNRDMMSFLSGVDGSPATFITTLMYKAITAVHPDETLPVVCGMQHQFRGAVGRRHSHLCHVNIVPMVYPDMLRDEPIDMLNTIGRGILITQADDLNDVLTVNAHILNEKAIKYMTIPEKHDYMRRVVVDGIGKNTFEVSYTGYVRWCGLEKYMADIIPLLDMSLSGGISIEIFSLEETFSALDEVEVSYTETAHGTKLLVCKENDGDGDTEYVQILTVYRGYLIEFDMETSEDAAEKSLTDEQIQMCIDFLSNLDFVEVKS